MRLQLYLIHSHLCLTCTPSPLYLHSSFTRIQCRYHPLPLHTLSASHLCTLSSPSPTHVCECISQTRPTCECTPSPLYPHCSSFIHIRCAHTLPTLTLHSVTLHSLTALIPVALPLTFHCFTRLSDFLPHTSSPHPNFQIDENSRNALQ